MNHHDWTRLEKSFWEERYFDFDPDMPRTNGWGVPLKEQNPDIIKMLLDLNERVRELERIIQDMKCGRQT